MKALLLAAGLALSLAACQSPQQNMADASYTCDASGLRPGTRAYDRCVNANFAQNERRSADTANAVAAGAAAAAVGGAIIGAASAPRPYYYCRGWGCW